MSEQFHGTVKSGVTDVSIPILLRDTNTAQAKTGVAYGSVTARYWRQGASPTTITMASLPSVTADHSDGGWYEVDTNNQPGLYRFDIPDAAFNTGADWVFVSVVVSGTFGHYERINVESGGVKEIHDEVTNVDYGLAQLLRSETPGNALQVDSGGNAYADVRAWLGTVPLALTSQLVQAQANQLGTTAKTEVNAEVDTALDDSISELPQGTPTATPSIRTALMLMYMSLRSKLTNDGTWVTFFNDAGTPVFKARISEASGLFTRSKMETA
jgi:hypothetical protein